jgi:hypothetical protein
MWSGGDSFVRGKKPLIRGKFHSEHDVKMTVQDVKEPHLLGVSFSGETKLLIGRDLVTGNVSWWSSNVY